MRKISTFVSKLRIFLIGAAFALLPAIAVAEDIEVTGDVLEMYADDFANHRAEKIYVLHDRTSGTVFRLRIRDGEHRELHTGTRVKVRGHQEGNEITLPANGTGVEMLEAAAVVGSGEQKTLIIGINFQNANLECSTAQIQGMMFSNASSVAGMYLETSLGALWFTGAVAGPFKINYNSAGACDYTLWANAADAAATAAGFDLSQYRHKVYVFPKVNDCSWAGLGTIGGNPSRAWIATCDLADVYAHELGHNLGLYHSSTDTNNDDTTDCEYCDNSDIMGYGGIGLRTLNGPHKEQMGWQGAGKVQSIVSNGVVMVAPLEMAPTDTPYPQTLKITKPGGTDFYYFAYRRALGYDARLLASYADRTSVHHYTGGTDNTFFVKALSDSGSFTDPDSGLTVVQLSHNTEFVTLDISYGCTRAAPTVTLTPSAQSSTPGKTVSYNISIQNGDSIACGSSTFLLSRTLPPGWTGSLFPPSITIAPGQIGTSQLSVTAPSDATSSNFPATIAVTDNFNPIHSVSTNVTDNITGGAPIDTGAPSVPLNLVATTHGRRVKLTWTGSTDDVGVTEYVILRDGVEVGHTKKLKFTNRGLTKGVTYSFSVAAQDAAGNQSTASSAAVIVAGQPNP